MHPNGDIINVTGQYREYRPLAQYDELRIRNKYGERNILDHFTQYEYNLIILY